MSSWIQNHFLPRLDQKAKIIMVIRHGHREENKQRSFGNELALTPEGRHSSLSFGSRLTSIPIGEVHTSPLLRCKQTADELLKGACQRPNVLMSQVLGNPGPFIADPEKAGPLFLQKPLQEIARAVVYEEKLPGMRSLEEGGHIFLKHIDQVKQFPCLMISHDIIICLLCCFLFKSKAVTQFMPNFLDGFGMVIDHHNDLSIYHRERVHRFERRSLN